MSEGQSDEWTTALVTDIASAEPRAIAIGPFGSRLKADLYVSDGFPVIRGQDIGPGKRLLEDRLVFVPESVAQSLSSCIVREGDLIFPHRGAIGMVGIVGARPYLLSSSMMKLTCNRELIQPEYVFYYFRGPGKDELLSRASTVGTPGIGQPLTSLRGIPITFPGLQQQRAITDVLGALDDKITGNAQLSATSASLRRAMFEAAVQTDAEESVLSEITVLVTRGVTPSYSETDDTIMVLNQKCVRDQRVVLGSARRTLAKKVRADKILMPNDVLINSTGQGTLGRVARWTRSELATTDSHISIVRFDETKTNTVVAGHGLLQLQSVIEQMGEGSTGQTELSRAELNKIRIRLPFASKGKELGLQLSELSRMESSFLQQNITLAATRDALLPALMSGKLRVRDAEKVLEGVL